VEKPDCDPDHISRALRRLGRDVGLSRGNYGIRLVRAAADLAREPRGLLERYLRVRFALAREHSERSQRRSADRARRQLWVRFAREPTTKRSGIIPARSW